MALVRVACSLPETVWSGPSALAPIVVSSCWKYDKNFVEIPFCSVNSIAQIFRRLDQHLALTVQFDRALKDLV